MNLQNILNYLKQPKNINKILTIIFYICVVIFIDNLHLKEITKIQVYSVVIFIGVVMELLNDKNK